MNGETHVSTHAGVGPVEALTTALGEHGIEVEVLDLYQSSIDSGSNSEALTLVEYRHSCGAGWAAVRERSVLAATMNAVMAAANDARRGTA